MPTIKRWLRRRRETGDVEPEPIPGRPSRKSLGRRSPPPPLGGLSPACPMVDGHSKKVTDSLRARRASQRFVAVAGFPLRRQAASVRGRIWLQHLHDAPESEGSEGTESLRQGSQKPRQEHYTHRRGHPPGRYR